MLCIFVYDWDKTLAYQFIEMNECTHQGFNRKGDKLNTLFSRPHLPSMLYVAAGSFSSDPTNTRYVEAIYIHENYDAATLENDIALVKVIP